MDATIENIYLDIPKYDMAFLKKLAKNMGWSLHVEPKSGIEKGLDDVKNGRVFEANNPEEMVKQILG